MVRNAVSKRVLSELIFLCMNLTNLSWFSSGRSSDAHQIIGDNAPTNPFIEASFAMIETTIQVETAFEDTDPPFDIIMPLSAQLEPTLIFKQFTFLGFVLVAGYGQIRRSWEPIKSLKIRLSGNCRGWVYLWGCFFVLRTKKHPHIFLLSRRFLKTQK